MLSTDGEAGATIYSARISGYSIQVAVSRVKRWIDSLDSGDGAESPKSTAIQRGETFSSQEKIAVRVPGLEPGTHGLKVRCSTD